jgi:GrpB-like predicted nucleotidyltransferase (UPF0157 family)
LLLEEVELSQYPREVTERFHGTSEQHGSGLVGERPQRWNSIVITDHDPAWADRFAATERLLRQALGDLADTIEHVGSTSVPGLAAKPIIDIDLTVADTGDESRYVPALEAHGFRLVLREPWWYGHRMLISSTEDVNLHVWPRGAPEPIRHRLFRDWLRSHPDDLNLYAATKRRLAQETARKPGTYNLAKNEVIDQIFARIFASAQ